MPIYLLDTNAISDVVADDPRVRTRLRGIALPDRVIDSFWDSEAARRRQAATARIEDTVRAAGHAGRADPGSGRGSLRVDQDVSAQRWNINGRERPLDRGDLISDGRGPCHARQRLQR